MKNKIKSINDIKSGYVIELENSKQYLIGRSKDFRKFGKSEDNTYISLDNLNNNFELGDHKIIKIYGLCYTPAFSFVASTNQRDLIWKREAECIWNLDLAYQDVLFLSNLNEGISYLTFNSNSISGKTITLLDANMNKIQTTRIAAYLCDFINAEDGVIYKRD